MRLFATQLVVQTYVEWHRGGQRYWCLMQKVPVSSGVSVTIKGIWIFFSCILPLHHFLFHVTDLKDYQY